MPIQLGENFWILIILMALELLLIFIPIIISAKIQKISIKQEFLEIGLFKAPKSFYNTAIKLILGIDFGIFLFIFSGILIFLFRNILVGNLLGIEFVEEGTSNIINTEPINPTLIELTIIIILQILITGPCEEGFFRGFLIHKLNSKLKLTYSVLISSVIFVFYHVPPFLVPIQTIITYFGYYFIIGLLMALLFIYSKGSLLLCSITHSVFNILVLIV